MMRDEAVDMLVSLRDGAQADVDLAELSHAVRRDWPDDFTAIFPAKQDLTGRPCPLNVRDYHLRELKDAIGAPRDEPPSKAERARIRYHAQWLLFLEAPGPATAPKVSLVIPIYNRAWAIESLVANCLRQTYANIELVIVDDGSTDGAGEVLRAFGDRIKLVEQENKGVSGARNAGIAAASGEFIHFLDSDNLLCPDHLAEKVQAFATIPDAQHCYCRATEVALFGALPAVKISNSFLAEEGELSPTENILTYSIALGFPFLVTASTLPRHILLGVAPAFDEDLPRREDARLWFRLGVAGFKTMRLGRALFYRIRMTDGLNEGRLEDKVSAAIVLLRSLLDLLQDADHWPDALLFLVSRRYMRRFIEIDGVAPSAYEADFRRLLQAVENLPKLEARTAIPALPVLMALSGFAEHLRKRARLVPQPWATLSASVAQTAGKTGDWDALNADFWREQRLDLRFAQMFPPFLSARVPRLSTRKAAELGLARSALKEAIVAEPIFSPLLRPLMTFVVPVGGRPDEALATIHTLLAQRMARLADVIVVDSDRQRLPQWRRLSPAVTALHAETFAEAHSVGLDARRTSFIRFLRPGDRLRPSALVRRLARALMNPAAVLVETDGLSLPRGLRSFDRLSPDIAVPLSRMWFPKSLFLTLGGFDAVLGNAFEKRFCLRLRAGRIPLTPVRGLTQWSDYAPRSDGGEMALDAVSSLALALRETHLRDCIPALFRDLAAAGQEGQSAAGTLLRRAYEVLRLELGSANPSMLPALALSLAVMEQYGAGLPTDVVELRAAMERLQSAFTQGA